MFGDISLSHIRDYISTSTNTPPEFSAWQNRIVYDSITVTSDRPLLSPAAAALTVPVRCLYCRKQHLFYNCPHLHTPSPRLDELDGPQSSHFACGSPNAMPSTNGNGFDCGFKRGEDVRIPTAEMVIRDRKEDCRGKRNREWSGVGRRAKQDGCGIVEVGSRMDIE